MHLCVLGRKLDKLVLPQWPMGMAGNRSGQHEGSQVLWPGMVSLEGGLRSAQVE